MPSRDPDGKDRYFIEVPGEEQRSASPSSASPSVRAERLDDELAAPMAALCGQDVDDLRHRAQAHRSTSCGRVDLGPPDGLAERSSPIVKPQAKRLATSLDCWPPPTGGAMMIKSQPRPSAGQPR